MSEKLQTVEAVTRQWSGHWLNAANVPGAATPEGGPAPYFRKVVTCRKKIESAKIYLCGLGYHVLYVNGVKADDRVLAPVMSQFDRRVSYVVYDVGKLFHAGKNAVVVLLGNGLYNENVQSNWNFFYATWRDVPKLLCDIEVNGEIVASSDDSWKVAGSHITYNQLRSGQHEDGRLRIKGVLEADFDDSDWKKATRCTPPGGLVCQETIEPCKVMKSIKPVAVHYVHYQIMTYDFGVNMSGWCRVKVRGKAGQRIWLRYSELVVPDSYRIERSEIDNCIKNAQFQWDQYTLAGTGEEEVFEPCFTYHGFRYVELFNLDQAEVLEVEAQFVHTAFEEVGQIKTSDKMLEALQRNTRQSFLSNFVGIPTDCPHREKNGWTGDAQLAAETGCWNFNTRNAFVNFMHLLSDVQWPNGQMPGMAPNTGKYYHRLNGPVYDSILFEYPYCAYLFSGDENIRTGFYEQQRKLMDYMQSMAVGDLLDFGLGDWCPWNEYDMTSNQLTSSCYYYQDAVRMQQLYPDKGEAFVNEYKKLASRIKKAFNAKFYNGDGTYENGSATALATALCLGLVEEKNIPAVAARLAEVVRKDGHRALFGMIGAKTVPRMLAEYGYVDDAYEVVTQTKQPGWGWQVEQGATSLWERWNGFGSRNHIMFGDISAWMFRYLGGLNPVFEAPGFRTVDIKPCFPKKLDSFSACYKSRFGIIRSEWRRERRKIVCNFTIPRGVTANIALPGMDAIQEKGSRKLTFSVEA
ncbi:MAG: family 78 glycoside hydrolase catalytic domain [Victivallales bacterium]|nr:family 78 glycoside hydrolase catalytic domain [Victivallales bacterium]